MNLRRKSDLKMLKKILRLRKHAPTACVTCAHKDIPTYPCPRIRYGIVPLVRHRDYSPSPQVFSNPTVLYTQNLGIRTDEYFLKIF